MNPRLERVLNALDRAYTGPVCTIKDWDSKVIPGKAREIVARHGLEKTCDPNEPVPSDDALADAYYQAGLEAALEIGMLCPDTERTIKVSEQEIKFALETAATELVLGSNADEVVMKPRLPEDPHPPMFAAPLCLVVSEDIWVPLSAGLVEKRELVDVFFSPSLPTVYGRKVRSGTPYETLVGRYEVQLRQEALYRAGRPDMCQIGIGSAITEFGQLGGMPAIGGGRRNIATSLCPAELKVTFANFHRIIQGINYDHSLRPGSLSYIGGYAGTPEAAVVLNIAIDLLIATILGNDYVSSNIYDARHFGNCGRDGVWANCMATQAVSRNTHLMRTKIINQKAGPCTEMLLHESAVGFMAVSVSGASKVCGPRTSGGKYQDYLTPLETWFCAEVWKSCAGMSRKQANELVKKLIPLYEDKMQKPPMGKSVRDCFDLENGKPSQEWGDIYQKVHNELVDMGMPLREIYW
jgi:methylamine---corrinoid protein Co-methyltransferase